MILIILVCISLKPMLGAPNICRKALKIPFSNLYGISHDLQVKWTLDAPGDFQEGTAHPRVYPRIHWRKNTTW